MAFVTDPVWISRYGFSKGRRMYRIVREIWLDKIRMDRLLFLEDAILR